MPDKRHPIGLQPWQVMVLTQKSLREDGKIENKGLQWGYHAACTNPPFCGAVPILEYMRKDWCFVWLKT